jgi:GrpB-like predicted nucleotidyltransferase (UPF0157 family)
MKPSSSTSAIYLITGPMAAGKSTVARLLAERFERGVYLEGDFFRRSIVSGRVEMTPDASAEAVEQLRLRYRLAAAAADAYFDAGFTVALEDVVAGGLLGEYRTMIGSRPCHVIVLMPSLEAIAAREAGRQQKGYTAWTVEELYEGFAATTPRVGLWLDTSDQTAEETVDEILARTPSVTHPVTLSDYDVQWPVLFRQIAEPVRHALGEIVVAVEHVGSTAVPGLAAKPVIDVDVVVRSAEDVPAATERLRELGYVYQGDKGIPDGTRSCGRRTPRDTTSTSSSRAASLTSTTSASATTSGPTRKSRASTPSSNAPSPSNTERPRELHRGEGRVHLPRSCGRDVGHGAPDELARRGPVGAIQAVRAYAGASACARRRAT